MRDYHRFVFLQDPAKLPLLAATAGSRGIDMEQPALSKGERTTQRILDEAEQLFARRGFAATGLRDIARAAGIREPGLYNYFDNKQALYRSVLDRALQPLADQLDALIARPDPSPCLDALAGSMIQLLARHPHIAALFQQALMQRGEPEQQPMEDWLEALVDRARQLLARSVGKHLGDDELALRIILFFNVAAGYFVAAPLLHHLTGREPEEAGLLAKQCALADQVFRTVMA